MITQRLVGYNLYLKPNHAAYRTLLKPLGLEYVPVTAPDPRPIQTPGNPPRPGYLIDVHRLTDEQVGHIVAALSIAFQASPVEVIVQILTVGLPILARDCDPPVPVYATSN
ncbi:MAG TPA: hypothetical protein VFR15_06900 [Chloroflexia bacterium]|nr:hypothetical protein [Chloroflexia bacterium]